MKRGRAGAACLGGAVTAVFLVAGCQGQQVTGEECGPNAACAAGFVLDGVFYNLSCTGVRPDAVGGRVSAEVPVAGADGLHAVHLVRGAPGP